MTGYKTRYKAFTLTFEFYRCFWISFYPNYRFEINHEKYYFITSSSIMLILFLDYGYLEEITLKYTLILMSNMVQFNTVDKQSCRKMEIIE